MEGRPHSTSSRPASGGLIRFQARLTDLVTWLGPAWACLCGVVASDDFGWQGEDWLRLALLLLLVDGGWGTLWAALGSTNWAAPLRRWRNWRFGDPATPLPYALPGSPGDRASRWLGQLRTWWCDVLWPACGPALSAIVVALPVTVVLGALLGPELLLLSAAAFAVMQLGLAWEGGRGDVTPEWDGVVAVALPWLAGHGAFGEPTLHSAGLALSGEPSRPGDARWESAPNSWRRCSSSHGTALWRLGFCYCCSPLNWHSSPGCVVASPSPGTRTTPGSG